MRRTLTIIAIAVIILGGLGYTAHHFDLLGLAKSIHGAAAQSHGAP